MDEISSKLDVSIINQTKLMTFLLPHEKKINRPYNLPALPLQSINDLRKFEKYLREPGNMSATVNYIDIYIMIIYALNIKKIVFSYTF
jgi:hypothetical protein